MIDTRQRNGGQVGNLRALALQYDGSVEAERAIMKWMMDSAMERNFFINGSIVIAPGSWVIKLTYGEFTTQANHPNGFVVDVITIEDLEYGADNG